MSSKNIQVAIKVRPLLRKEREQKQTNCWKIVENSIQLIDSQTEPFYFDHIFNQDASNQIIFDKMAKHIVHSGVQGFNGTIFAYGQTSSGKTYTMMGDDQNPGVMVLAAKEIFKEIEKASERQFLLRVGYIEIYNEKIYDLLNKKNQDLKIHETGAGIVSVNCEECIITCEDQLLNYLCMGSKERTVGETNMNERSSRSHAIFRIIIESRKIDRSEDDSVNQSVLNLVDLAGSERADQTGARGTRLKEGGHINKSLLFLSNVIKTLSENNDGDSNKYISFRDSKLTRILQASLGGNALTSIICTIKPTAVEETQSTLSFAMRAKSIKNKPQVNEIVSEAAMMKRLEREINLLKTQLAEERSKNKSQIKVGQLEQRIKHEVVKIISCNSLHTLKQQKENRRRTWCPATSKVGSTEAVSVSPPAAAGTDANTNNNASSAFSNLPQPQMFLPTPNMTNSRLPLPKPSKYCTPLITLRNTTPHEVNKPQVEPDIDEEVFAPGEMCSFEPLSPSPPHGNWRDSKSPQENENISTISITPKVTANVHSKLKLVENALVELEEFTNLENKLDIKHDTYEALKEQLQVVKVRNSLLETERLDYLELKDEHAMTQQKYNECLKHCDELEIQISKLTQLHHNANTKIASYEKQLEELNEKIQQLEMENRNAVSLDFEYQSHKNKAKLRETELLEALTEKDKEIVKLERSLNAIAEEKLQNTKAELMQLTQVTNETPNEDGQICIKCEDLARMLEENKKLSNDFEKLTVQYEQLQLNYNQLAADASQVQAKLKDLEYEHSVDEAECNKLHTEITTLREKLEQVQADYTAVCSDNKAKTEAYEALNVVINTARAEMLTIQTKYENLEGVWQQQQQTIKDIQTEYDAIQLKYQCLKDKYDQLEHTALSTQSDCARLQAENESLQVEINELKQRVEQAQQQLLESSYSTAGASSSTKTELVAELAKLKEENDALQAEHTELQKEYDLLSNQLMDQLQEGEDLKENNNRLEAQLCLLKAQQAKDAAEYESTRWEMEEQLKALRNVPNCITCSSSGVARDSLTSVSNIRSSSESMRSESMRSSGLGIDESDTLVINTGAQSLILQQFTQLAESLDEIELEYKAGQCRCYRFVDRGEETAKKHKLCMIIKNIQEVICYSHAQDANYGDKPFNGLREDHVEEEQLEMQGTMTRHTFKIIKRQVEENDQDDEVFLAKTSELESKIKLLTSENQEFMDAITLLKSEVDDLRRNNQYLNSEKQTLVESTERTINEMREEVSKLTAELFEKSLFVEKCACTNYQKQIETLVKERAEMSMLCEELQAKTMNTSSDMCLSMNISLSRYDTDHINRSVMAELQKEEKVDNCAMTESTDTIQAPADLTKGSDDAETEQLNKLQNEIKLLNQEIEELQNTVAKLNIDLVEEKSHLEVTMSEMQKLDEKNDEYKQQLTAKQAQHERELTNYAETIEQLKQAQAELQEQNATAEEAKNTSLRSIETLLKQKQEHDKLMETKQREFNDERNRLQQELLEKLEKLELNETQGRESLRKYNKEREESREHYERIIADLREQLDATKSCQCAQLEKERQSLLEDVQRLNKAQYELKEAQEEAKKQYDKSLESLVECFANSKRELVSKTERILEIEQHLRELMEQKQELEKQTACSKAEFLDITEKLEELKEQNQRLEVAKNVAEVNLAVIKQEKDAAVAEAKKLVKESTSDTQLEIELLELREKLREATQARTELKEQLGQQEKALIDTQLHLGESNKQLAQKIQQITDMEKRACELLIESESLKQQIHSLREQIVQGREELQNMEQNYEQLKAATNMLKEEKAQLAIKASSLEDELEATKCKCATLGTDIERLHAEIEKIQHELNSAKQSHEERQQELLKQTARQVETDNVLEHVNTMLTTKKQEISKMQLHLDELVSVQQKLLKEIQDLQEQNSNHAETIEQLKQAQAELQEQNATAEEAKNTALRSIETLLEQKQEVEEEKKILLSEKLELQRSLESARQDSQTLQHKLAKCIEDKQLIENMLSKSIEEKQQTEQQLSKSIEDKQQAEQQLSKSIEDKKQAEFERDQLQREKQMVDKLLLEFESIEGTREKTISELREKLQYFEQLSKEHDLCQQNLITLKQEHKDSLNKLQQEKQDLQLMLNNVKIEKSESEAKLETLELKLKSLKKDHHETKNRAMRHDQLLMEHVEMKKTLKQAIEEKEANMKLVQHLQEQLHGTKTKVNVAHEKNSDHVSHSKELEQKYIAAQATATKESARCAELERKLVAAQNKALAAEKNVEALNSKMGYQLSQLNVEHAQLRREIQDLQGRNAELQLKCQSLEASKDRLHHSHTAIEHKFKTVHQQTSKHTALNEEIAALKTEKQELQSHMTATVEEAGNCTRILRDDLARHKELLAAQVEACNQLRTLLTTKENAFKEEKEKLQGTIDSLISDKRNLNDRRHAVSETTLKKNEDYKDYNCKPRKSNGRADSPNSSMEGNASLSPQSRRSFDRLVCESHQLKSINLNLEDKLMALQQKTSQHDLAERKSRRLSTHDERRRQSMWVSSRDAAVLTDPTDPSCKCVELDEKLKECEKNLFIRECQVATLNLQTKNQIETIKAEATALKKRLQEEQDKSRNEIKKYKQIIVDQKTRATSAINAAAAATNVNKDADAKRQASPPKVTTKHTETQTESDLEAALNKMESKYCDLKNICRFRHTTIKELEKKIALLSKEKEKENASSNGQQLSSLEAGQLQALKQQSESLKKELQIYKQKYEEAKIVLNSRRAEIKSLRDQLNTPAN